MSVIETFDKYIKEIKQIENNLELKNIVQVFREYLLELRSEDERTRFFEEFIKTFYNYLKNISTKK